MNHPEIDGDLGKALAKFGKVELVDVWCTGCNGFVKMNAAYAKYLSGEISSCAKCRGLKLK